MDRHRAANVRLPSSGGGRGHAVVIGAGMAGLIAARVLSDHFDRVTLIERDSLPEGPGFRSGVPQSRHLHILLRPGTEVLEDLFPGLTAELTAAGAVIVQWPAEVLWLTPAGWSQRFHHPAMRIISCSRFLLEWAVRRRVLALPNISLRLERDVSDLLTTPDKTRVVGVRHEPRSGAADDGASEETAADLVVDASGRNSRAPRWLVQMGHRPPEETVVTSFLGYASRFYAPPADFRADWKMQYLQPQPPHDPRAGAIVPVERQRWLVTLAGARRDYPPTDEAGFLEFARGLRTPVLYDAIRDAEPLSPIHGYQRTANVLRRYERLERFPEQFLVMGDAGCALNPLYGQGMSLAAREGVVLDACLREQRRRHPSGDLSGLGRRFQRRIGRLAAGAWLFATGEDLRYPEADGPRPDAATKLTHRYLDRVVATATEHAEVNRAYLEVLNLEAAPRTLFRPSVLLPVLLHRQPRRSHQESR